MKRIKLAILSFTMLLVVTACACTTWKSYTYEVTTGDKIEIKLKTGDGYAISSNVPFEISKSDSVLSQGTFIKIDDYDQYVNNAKQDSKSKILESSTKDGITYVFYNYNDQEYNYIISIDNSNTAIVLGNNVSESSAREVFDRLSFKKIINM